MQEYNPTVQSGTVIREKEPLSSFCEDETIAMWGCHSSSREAFEAIVKRHMKDAYFIALGLVGNHEDALELSQEAFFRAYRNIKQLSSEGKFFPWFYQILRNLCFSHLRRRRLRQAESLDEFQENNVQVQVHDAFDPGVVAERNEEKDRIWKAIGQLDEKHREVIILRHFRNLSYEEISKILFCNTGTVTSRLYYARKRLKEILDSGKGGQ
jgi:RNA polymerase sigma-70 factor (ECF subfamily)